MAVLNDNFTGNSGWAEAAGHVDATQNVANGVMAITVTTDYTTSIWTKNGFAEADCIIVAHTSGANGSPQIHVRESDEDNFLSAYIDSATGNFIIMDRDGGVETELQSQAIPDWNVNNNYIIVVKVFANAFHAILLDENQRQLLINSEVSSTISDQTGLFCGVGASGSASYRKAFFRSVEEMTTIVCLGDSNTDGSADRIDQEDEFPQIINARRIYDNLVCIEAGKAGDNIAECEARVATEVAPYYVAGHRNVCIMQMGTNDRADGFTAAQAWTRYQSCLNAVKAANFDEVYINTGFPNTKDDAANTQWNEDLNADILADEATYGYTAVRIWAAFGGQIGSGFPYDVDLLWYTANNPHASEAGHLIFAREDLLAIKKNTRTLAT